MEKHISIHKRKRFSDIQLILTFAVSISLLAACPAPEDREEAQTTSSKYINISPENYSFEKVGEIPSKTRVRAFRLEPIM
ncbi:MAG: hypothetical protein WD431_25470 [Cyclobacteriaceae bacterium]